MSKPNPCDPDVAQMAGLVGYDWVLIDTEYNPLTESQVQGHLYALTGHDVTIIVRVRANCPEHVEWVLDSGAVQITKYHPLGMRGVGANRANGFWSQIEQYNNAQSN